MAEAAPKRNGGNGPAVESVADPFAHLLPLLKAKGVRVSPREFHRNLNLVFHACEARHYDVIHRDMWKSLPEQFELLVNDYFNHCSPDQSELRMLDIGCGTGMSAELLLRTRLGPFITDLDLLDTSDAMLEICRGRKAISGVRHRLVRGSIEDLAKRQCYDVIVASSVLHHIPDLADLGRTIERLQSTGGIFLHVHDPNGDYFRDPIGRQRSARLRNSYHRRISALLKRMRPSRFWRHYSLTGSGATYIDAVNDELLSRGLITDRLSPTEVWAVTDIHVHDGRGISIRQMRSVLPGYELISSRSYGFFGELPSNLPASFRREERSLIETRAANGCFVGAVWARKRPGANLIS